MAGFATVIVIAIASLAVVLSYTTDCGPAPELVGDTATMKAVVYRCYGGPEVLEYRDVEIPVPGDNEVLVKVRAAAVNPLDWHYMRGSPFIMRLSSGIGAPDDPRMGADFAGTVESVGKNVTRFSPGDDVFGGRSGAFAEYVLVPEDRALVKKPEGVSFEQAAAIPVAALTALQALRDKGELRAGQKVLINGASGGVGTFAVQIAKSMGAEVSGVCSTRNVEMVRSIGADHVFDYKKEDYTKSDEQFDLIVDMVGNHSLLANRAVMKPGGKLIIVGGSSGDWLGPLMRPIAAMLISPFVDHEFEMILARLAPEDLYGLGELVATGHVVPVIDRTYALSDVAEAIAYSEEGHARGKIIVDTEL
jgi:NADPH:quinone reductase-like Zn-dependent oxidoreductase